MKFCASFVSSIHAATFGLLFVARFPPPAAHGFTFNALNIPSPVLDKFAQDGISNKGKPYSSREQQQKQESGTRLDIVLDVDSDSNKKKNPFRSGYSSSGPRMSLTGLQLELLPDSITKSDARHFPSLPGANGPNPKSSTGAKQLVVTQEPSFIDQNGLQHVQLDESGCWEVVWRKGASHGSLVCALDSPNEYKRNDATLPQGTLYLSFSLWTVETLQQARKYKQATQTRAQTYLKDKAKFMALYEQESNLFQKAMHYRKALTAAELYSLTGVDMLDYIPDQDSSSLSANNNKNADSSMMLLQDDVLLSTSGTLWLKTNHNKGGFAMFGPPSSVKTLLGTARVVAPAPGTTTAAAKAIDDDNDTSDGLLKP